MKSLTIKASCTVFKSCIVNRFTSLEPAPLKLVIFGSVLLLNTYGVEISRWNNHKLLHKMSATLPTHNGMIFSSESIIPYQCINCCTTSWLINSPISSDSRWDIKIDIETCWWLVSCPIKWNIKVRANQLTVLWVNFVHACWIVLTCNN